MGMRQRPYDASLMARHKRMPTDYLVDQDSVNVAAMTASDHLRNKPALQEHGNSTSETCRFLLRMPRMAAVGGGAAAARQRSSGLDLDPMSDEASPAWFGVRLGM